LPSGVPDTSLLGVKPCGSTSFDQVVINRLRSRPVSVKLVCSRDVGLADESFDDPHIPGIPERRRR
jgi:hypothetical protein